MTEINQFSWEDAYSFEREFLLDGNARHFRIKERRSTMKKFCASVCAFLIAVPTLSLAQNADIKAGEQEYMVACAGCHGESGKGDGPLAGLLEIETPSLTTITARTGGGDFPFYNTLKLIDGRDVRAHGGNMPIWGERFQVSATSQRGETADMVARGRLLSLVYYLESIQE